MKLYWPPGHGERINIHAKASLKPPISPSPHPYPSPSLKTVLAVPHYVCFKYTHWASGVHATQGEINVQVHCSKRTNAHQLLQTVAGAVIIIAGYFLSPIVLRYTLVDQNGNRIPPGPPVRYAFLRKYAEKALHSWANQYGDLFSIWMGSQLFVVISDPHVAKDLLVTNGAIFSSRKRYFMKNQVILRGRAITASVYGNTWYG